MCRLSLGEESAVLSRNYILLQFDKLKRWQLKKYSKLCKICKEQIRLMKKVPARQNRRDIALY